MKPIDLSDSSNEAPAGVGQMDRRQGIVPRGHSEHQATDAVGIPPRS